MSALGPLDADYEALRRGAGAYALPRDVVHVEGPEAASYLQGQCSQDIGPLAVGDHTWSLLLAPDGKLVAVVRVTRLADDAYLLDADGGYGDAVAARLARFKLRTKVTITQLDWSCWAVRGDGAASVAERLGAEPTATPGTALESAVAKGPSEPPTQVLGFEWNGWRGFDVLGPSPAMPAGNRRCDSTAWEACRVELGVPVMGRELDARTIPAEVPQLVARTVSFTKGCYTGQELVARLESRGSRVARRLCAVVPNADAGRALVAGAELVVPGRDKPVGHVTSAAWCPGLGGLAGLAYVHRSVPVGAEVTVRAGVVGGAQGVGAGDDAHQAPVNAEVRSLPLVDA